MKIYFIGSFYPPDRMDEIRQRSVYIDTPGNVLQWELIDGFYKNNSSLVAITVPATKWMKRLYFKDSHFLINKHENYCIGYLDIVGLKQVITSRKIINITKHFNFSIENDVLFVYSIQSGLLRAVYNIKKKYPKLKVILLVTDLPEFMNHNPNFIYKILKYLEIRLLEKYYTSINGYVLLSKLMTEKLPLENKPFIVMEGIFTGTLSLKHSNKKNNLHSKIIMYSGSLSKKYGILNLINAFMKIDDEHITLLICGSGDTEEEIKEACKIDRRISFLGLIERAAVLNLQQESDLLVNPRSSEGEYTKFSFPSKTMEYLGSGTPTLLYKLPGIPEEYYNYCFFLDEIGIDPLKKKIEEILNMPKGKLNEIGRKAQMFIYDQKSSKAQCARIIEFINHI